ncbi:MAG: deoxyribodipyrimidine photo-lyase [Candidatus Hodarchaeota archaeon]
MINGTRVKMLNKQNIRDGKFVLYWMQATHRTEYNHALEYSILKSNKLNRPLLVYFGIIESYPEANERHYYFMLKGLKEVQTGLKEKGIKMVIKRNSPEIGATKLAKSASLVVVDQAYTKIERRWTKFVAEKVRCPLFQVESNVIVPVTAASPKEEYSAATFRPKIKKVLDRYLIPIENNFLKKSSLQLDFSSFNIRNVRKAIFQLEIDRSVNKVKNINGGTAEAKKHLNEFIKTKLDNYPELRNDPTKQCHSNMSPFLHFGQISPLYIALKILETDSPGKDAYLEELIIRRELAINFVFYNTNYDSFNGLPEWTKKTLNEHRKDERTYIYSLREMENYKTHDSYWNASQKEMVITGKMHGYMRMYWGKKIIEWSNTPEEAYQIALYLNNKYQLDGRDPNGFAGIAWCFGKHDRPWKERAIFGKIRYMNANGLKRKFDADAYVEMISKLSS